MVFEIKKVKILSWYRFRSIKSIQDQLKRYNFYNSKALYIKLTLVFGVFDICLELVKKMLAHFNNFKSHPCEENQHEVGWYQSPIRANHWQLLVIIWSTKPLFVCRKTSQNGCIAIEGRRPKK